MNISKEDAEYIKDEVQEIVDCGWEMFGLEDYIDNCDHLTAKEKKWAKKNLGVHVEVDILHFPKNIG